MAGSCQVVFTVSCPHSKCLQVSSRNCGADESEVRRRMALSAEFMIFRVYVLCVVITEIDKTDPTPSHGVERRSRK